MEYYERRETVIKTGTGKEGVTETVIKTGTGKEGSDRDGNKDRDRKIG